MSFVPSAFGALASKGVSGEGQMIHGVGPELNAEMTDETHDEILKRWPFEEVPDNFSSRKSIVMVEDDGVTPVLSGKYGTVFKFDVNTLMDSSKIDQMKNDIERSFNLGIFRPLSKKEDILCLYRFKIWWMRPIHCNVNKNGQVDIPQETQFILAKDSDDKNYRIIMPVPLVSRTGCSTCSLFSESQSSSSGVHVSTESLCDVAVYFGLGDNPYTVIEEAALFSKKMLAVDGTMIESLHVKKHNLLGSLGWCTWNSFYTEVNGLKVLQGLERLYESGFPQFGFVILDDGWQHTTNDIATEGDQWGERLVSFDGSPLKFSGKDGEKLMSLGEMVALLKEPRLKGGGGVESVLAWHALPGYWLGVDERCFSYLHAKTYFPKFSSGIIQNDQTVLHEQSLEKGIGIANASSFYQGYHSKLADAGFDGVKVDAQGVSGTLFSVESKDLNKCSENNHEVCISLHNALSESVSNHFSTAGIIHCMCHAPEIFYRFPLLYKSKPIMRASDDFYPDDDLSHGPHIIDCTYNSLLFHSFAIPDWDMFRTDSASELQAVSRAISGGPIYVSDIPGSSNIDVLNRLVCKDGTALHCDGPLLPIRDCLLKDPSISSSGLISWNVNKYSYIFGIFNVAGSRWNPETSSYSKVENYETSKQKIRTKVSPDMIETLNVRGKYSYLLFASRQKLLGFVEVPSEFVEVEVSDAEVITVLPVDKLSFGEDKSVGIVPIGFANMYNPNASICDKQVFHNSMQCKIKGCGTFLVAVTCDVKVTVDGVVVSLQEQPSSLFINKEREDFRLFKFDISTKDRNRVKRQESAITIEVS